ncbi:MAG: hypothetical protein QM582_19020 [Micropruina sp.]|uniref:hypothetical protein n=1 Tax=Micropruina sp. TaxID=2737536 RepID=UPI0039E5D2CD
MSITREQYIEAQQAGLNSGPGDVCPDYPHPLLKTTWRKGHQQVMEEQSEARAERYAQRYPKSVTCGTRTDGRVNGL